MGTYFRKVDKNLRSDVFDTTVSSFYGDLGQGKETTLTSRAGRFQDCILFDFPVPSAPSFGAGELTGFKFEFQMDSDVIDGIVFGGPFSLFMMKDGKQLGNEEGTANRVTDSTNNVFAPAAVIACYHQDYNKDPPSVYVENFNDSGPDIITHSVPGTMIKDEFFYITKK